MANSGIEDILIGESYNSTKKKSKGPVIFLIILIIAGAIFAGWYYFSNQNVVDEKTAFSQGILNACNRKLSDSNFYITILNRMLDENSEMTINATVSSTEEFEKLQGIDVGNFDFELTSQNNMEEKNLYGELLINYSGNEFLKIKSIINGEKFATISDEIVNKYVGVKAENFNDIFESDIDLEFIYEMINSEKIDITEDELKTYLEKYYNKIYDQIPVEKFTKKENIVITQNNNYVDVTAYELTLSQTELKDILLNVLTDFESDNDLLDLVIEESSVQLDLSENNQEDQNTMQTDENIESEDLEDMSQEENGGEGQDGEIPPDIPEENGTNPAENDENPEGESEPPQGEDDNIDAGNEGETTLQLTPVSEVNFNAANGSLSLVQSEEESDDSEEEFTTKDLIKILLGRKVKISKDKIIEKIDEYVQNLEGNGITITIYVSDEKTEKISLKLPNENTLDIQLLENTEKENTVEFTYLYKNSDYKNGISLKIDEVQNSASSSIKIVKNTIENENINKKVSCSIQTSGGKNASTISNDIVFTTSTDSSETKIVLEGENKFTTNNLVIEKLSDENSVFLDDLEIEERDSIIQAIKDKIDSVLNEKKEYLNLIDLNSGTSVVSQNFQNTTNNYIYIKSLLEDKINELKTQAEENEEEFTIQNLENLSIDGVEVTTTLEEERVIITINEYSFSVDAEFNITDN